MAELVAVFTAGLLSSAHCIGMCGGLAAALGATEQPLTSSIPRHLLYGVGRITTYSFLGAVGGFAGLYLSRYDTTLLTVQQAFSVSAGVLMLFVGASAMGLLRVRRLKAMGLSELFAPIFSHFLNARRWSGFYLAGIANGFLPCGLVYAFLAEAVAVGGVSRGAAVMAAFGLGTMPAMTFIGCGSTLLAHRMRAHVFRVAGAFIMVFGVATIVRAFPGKDGCCPDGDVVPLRAAWRWSTDTNDPSVFGEPGPCVFFHP